jgi:hypothetical protein
MNAVSAYAPHGFYVPNEEPNQTLLKPRTIPQPSTVKIAPELDFYVSTLSRSFSNEFVYSVSSSTGQVIYYGPYKYRPMPASLTGFEIFLAVLALLAMIAMIIGFVVGGLFPGQMTGIILPLGVWVFFVVGVIARRVQHRTK